MCGPNRKGQRRSTCRIFAEECERPRPLCEKRSVRRLEDNIKIVVWFEGRNCVHTTQDRDQYLAVLTVSSIIVLHKGCGISTLFFVATRIMKTVRMNACV